MIPNFLADSIFVMALWSIDEVLDSNFHKFLNDLFLVADNLMTNMFEADKVDRQAAKDEKKRKKDAKKRKLQEKKQASHDLVSNILSSMPGNHGMWKKTNVIKCEILEILCIFSIKTFRYCWRDHAKCLIAANQPGYSVSRTQTGTETGRKNCPVDRPGFIFTSGKCPRIRSWP